jgi:branched-chain amino acid transport system ATP-binding protein
MSCLLEVADIRVRYGNSPAVNGVSLTVDSGEMLAIAGANGAGKSTLVNAIAGWSRGPAKVEGVVMVNGIDLSRSNAQQRTRSGVAMVPEARGAFGEMSVEENLRMVRPAAVGRGKSYSVDDIFDIFPQLRERAGQRSATLSGGERQMVSIGRALRAAPTLLILDEPSVGLAPRVVLEILQHIRQLVQEGLAVLLVEQNVRAALEVADRLSLIEQGRVVATGTAAEMADDERTVKAYLGGLHP